METNEVNLVRVCQSVLGMTPMRYRQLAAEGFLPPVVKGKIGLLVAIKMLLEYYRGRIKKGETATLQGERKRKIEIERKLKELKLMIRSGELIPRSEIGPMVSARQACVRKGLIRFARTLKKKLRGDQDPREMGEIIQKEVFRFLDKMSGARLPVNAKKSRCAL